jgi:hypothetical protein
MQEKAMDKAHPDDKFLQEYFKYVRDEMNWRRELEFRLLQFMLIFYPIMGTAMVTLYQSTVTVSLTGVYCTRRDRLVCTTRSRLHVYQA